VPPRQVLIDAKIYEVDLNGQFSAGVQAFLQRRGAAQAAAGGEDSGPSLSRTLMGSSANGALTLTAGLLVGQSRELLALLTAQEQTTRARIISAPSLIATDSVPATMNVGESVPTLSSQAVAGGVQVGGNSLFTNTITNQITGVTMNVLARVNSSGIVTLMINQEVSAPVAPSPSAAIQSPSFSRRTFQTQVTVQDGDTVAIGGIIQETDTNSSGGIPFLHRIPVLGIAFGNKNSTKTRTELVVFMTPRVIYDTNQITEASDDLVYKLRRLQKMIRE
jgi:general secretion pathway protein D